MDGVAYGKKNSVLAITSSHHRPELMDWETLDCVLSSETTPLQLRLSWVLHTFQGFPVGGLVFEAHVSRSDALPKT